MVADCFGNIIQCYSVLPPHQRLVITATSVVETSSAAINGAPLTPMERHDFSIASQYVPCTAALLAFAHAYQVRTQVTLEVWGCGWAS
jgi:hypothetical protein